MSHVPKDIMTIFICQEIFFWIFSKFFNYDDEKMMTSRKKADKTLNNDGPWHRRSSGKECFRFQNNIQHLVAFDICDFTKNLNTISLWTHNLHLNSLESVLFPYHITRKVRRYYIIHCVTNYITIKKICVESAVNNFFYAGILELFLTLSKKLLPDKNFKK